MKYLHTLFLCRQTGYKTIQMFRW